MAGTLYLGRNKVCPAILVGSTEQKPFANYSIVDGVTVYATGELTGDEFNGIVVADENSSTGYPFLDFSHTTISGVVYFKDLETVEENGLYGAFSWCQNITGAVFNKLKAIERSGLSQCFAYCFYIKDIYFYSLKTDSFNGRYVFDGMMRFTYNYITHTIHFPSNLETTIQGLSGYPNFGGTSGYVVLAFDLPATE